MTRLASLIGFTLVGLLVATLAGIDDLGRIDHSPAYLYGTSLLLAIGLYGSTYGIDLTQAGRNRRIIVLAVTVGVLVKAALIGGVLFAATRNPLYLILGVAVAQIDPLSVAALMGDRRMSSTAKAILGSWSAFDDPLTVVLAVYASAVATRTFGLGETPGHGFHAGTGLAAYGADLLANLALAALAYLAWRLVRRRAPLAYAVLLVVAAVAIWQFLMLGLALVGLFLRPPGLARVLPRTTQVALAASAVLLGVLMIGGVNLAGGVALGLAAFAAQVVVGYWLTHGLPRTDRTHLAFAQQNGITAMILALRLEAQFAGVVAAVAPAILVTNLTHLLANRLVDRRNAARAEAPGPDTDDHGGGRPG